MSKNATTGKFPWKKTEEVVRHDPAGRGVAGYRHEGQPLATGQLQAAACELAESATAVGIVTGFCVLNEAGWAAETDGPPGALFLARTLLSLGVDVVLLSDAYGLPVLETGCDCWRISRSVLWEIPFEADEPDHPSRRSNSQEHNTRTDRWVDEFLASPAGCGLSHLIAIERVGPSHTLESIARPPHADDNAADQFAETVPPEHRDVCHNMRGESINAHTAKAHRLFERIEECQLPIKTLGIGDGGNEIGLGGIPWNVLRRAIAIGPAERVACRIATDYTLIAGVSNWAGYALAMCVAALKDARVVDECDGGDVRRLIETLVRETFCVDGVSKEREPTVDGLPLDEEIRVFTRIGELLQRR